MLAAFLAEALITLLYWRLPSLWDWGIDTGYWTILGPFADLAFGIPFEAAFAAYEPLDLALLFLPPALFHAGWIVILVSLLRRFKA